MFNRFRNKMKTPQSDKEARREAVRRQMLIARQLERVKRHREAAQVAKDTKDAANKV